MKKKENSIDARKMKNFAGKDSVSYAAYQPGEEMKMVPALEINGKVIAKEVPQGVNHGHRVEKIIDFTVKNGM